MAETVEPRIRKVYKPPAGGIGLFFKPEQDQSNADLLAAMSDEERADILKDVSEEELEALEWDSTFWLRPSQLAVVNSCSMMTVALAGRGWGKSNKCSTPLATVHGWTTIGDVQPGEQIFGTNGQLTTVLAKSPVWLNSTCYEVFFSDDTSLIVSAEHEWTVETIKRPKTLTIDTDTLYRTHRQTDARKSARYRIPMPDPIQLPHADLPLHPYVMGLWLGDGAVNDGTIATHLGSPEEDVWATLRGLGYDAVRQPPTRSDGVRDVRHVYMPDGGDIRYVLDGMGVLGSKSLPQAYLRASVAQRMELLRGICDADGYIDPKTGKIEITTVNQTAAKTYSELLSTLGIKHTINTNDINVGGLEYQKHRVIFHAYENQPVFHIRRKLARQKPVPRKRSQSASRYIVHVEPVDSVPTQCIQVDSPDHLFLVGEKMVPTHNSHVLSIAMHEYAMKHPKSRLVLLGRTTSDVRDVMIFGASGIMSIVNPAERPKYNPANRRLTWPNGTYALCYSAERADSLRGVQAHASFCDEVAAYRDNPGSGLANAFDQVRLLTRLPYQENCDCPNHVPQVFVATTPKRVPMILDLVKKAEEDGPDKVLIVRGPTRANRSLPEAYKENIEGMYAGTAIGKQELEGELLMDVEGALLTQPVIDGTRVDVKDEAFDPMFWKDLPYRVIGVDPSVSSEPNDECGIVAVGATAERKMYQRKAFVIEDASIIAAPDVWAKKVVEMARKYRAIVVAEKNQGGEMVRMVLKQADPYVPVVLVHAAVSKEQRAEPVGTAYERGSVVHVGDGFPELEAQLTSWAPKMGMASPDRMDALVHAVTALLIKPPKEMVGEIKVAGDPSKMRVDVKDHSPGGAKPATANQMSDKDIESAADDNQQVVFSKVRRKKTMAIGQRDLRLGGQSSYTAPNRFGRPSSYR